MLNEKLTQQQIVAAQLLASGSVEKQEIAKSVGCSRSTLYNWINKDENFIAEVDRLRHELKVFGEDLIAGRLVDAVKGYWDLIIKTDNARVAADGYRYFIDRNLGKPTTKLDVEAGMKQEQNLDNDILEAEFDDWDKEG
jgi:transcriptional regulator with XRE-family HTH domain